MTALLRRVAVPAALLLSLSACGGGGSSAQPKVTSTAPTDKVLRLSFLQDPGQPPDPDIYYAGQGLILTQNLYEGLLKYKEGVDKPEFAASLATAWQASPDNKTFTLTLRPGVTFHDGTPFTSSAIKPSFDRRAGVNQGPAYMVSDVVSVATPSPTTAVITLKSPNSAFLDYLASPYGPKMMSPAILSAEAGKDLAQTYLQTHDAGTGPYTLTKAAVGQAYQMKAYPQWWGSPVYFQSVELPVISDLSTQQLLLNNGQLHGILHDLNAPAVKSYLGNNAVKSWPLPSFTTEQVYVNPNTGFLKDLAARRAFRADAATLTGGRSFSSAGPVDIGSVLDGDDGDVVCDEVHDAEVTAACAMQPFQFESQRFAHSVRVAGKRPVAELDHSRAHLLWQLGQGSTSSRRPCDLGRALAHRRSRSNACCLVSAVAGSDSSSTRLSRIWAISRGRATISNVSSNEARSSTLTITAAGRPCLVITTRSCSRSTWSTTSESRFLTSFSAICASTVMAISVATSRRGYLPQ